MNFMKTEFYINRLSLAFFILSVITCVHSVCDDSFDKTIRKEIEENSKNNDPQPQLVPGNKGTITYTADSTSLTLSWAPAESLTNKNQLTQYYVYSSTSNVISDLDTVTMGDTNYDVGTQTTVSIPISDLLPGTVYYFNVLAYVNPHSCVYTTISVTTPPLKPVGLIPGNGGIISISNVSSTGVTLSWVQAVNEMKTVQPIHYTVYFSAGNDIASVETIKNGKIVGEGYNMLTLPIKNLQANITYYFNVLSTLNDTNLFECVYTTIAVTTPSPAPAELVPGNGGIISISNVSSTGATLTWKPAVINMKTVQPIHYTVYSSLSNDIASVETIRNGMNEGEGDNLLTLPITNLQADKTYYFNVLATLNNTNYYECGYSTIAVTTPPPTPAELLPGNKGIISISNVSSNGVTLTWVQAVNQMKTVQPIHYTVYSSLSNDIASVETIRNGMNEGEGDDISTLSITSLQANTTYYFNVLSTIPALSTSNTVNSLACVYTTVSLTTLPEPTPVLVPGNNGTILVSNVSKGGITLKWTKAITKAMTKAIAPVSSSAVNAVQPINYIVYLSKNNDINNVAGIKANGIEQVVGTDIDTADISKLTAGIYYFNIYASMGTYECVYTTVSATILSSGTIYMFSSGDEIKGNLGGRTGADQMCRETSTNSFPGLGLSESNVHAFLSVISVNGNDSIADMPINYNIPDYFQISGPGGIIIANDWLDLLDGAILTSLTGANVSPSGTKINSWWSGSLADGSASTDNCVNWTDNGGKAIQGSVKDADETWLEQNNTSCNSKGAVLCIGW